MKGCCWSWEGSGSGRTDRRPPLRPEGRDEGDKACGTWGLAHKPWPLRRPHFTLRHIADAVRAATSCQGKKSQKHTLPKTSESFSHFCCWAPSWCLARSHGFQRSRGLAGTGPWGCRTTCEGRRSERGHTAACRGRSADPQAAPPHRALGRTDLPADRWGAQIFTPSAEGTAQPDNTVQESKRLKLNTSCPQLKRIRECTNYVNNRLLFCFLSCILDYHCVFTVSFIPVLLNCLLPVSTHSFLSKSDHLSENWQTRKIFRLHLCCPDCEFKVKFTYSVLILLEVFRSPLMGCWLKPLGTTVAHDPSSSHTLRRQAHAHTHTIWSQLDHGFHINKGWTQRVGLKQLRTERARGLETQPEVWMGSKRCPCSHHVPQSHHHCNF